MKKIFYTTADNGDGSSSVWFFESQECIQALENHDPGTWAAGEGGGSFLCERISEVDVLTIADVMGIIQE